MPRKKRGKGDPGDSGAPQELTQGDALAAIAAEAPEAMKLVGDLMRRNADDVIFGLEQQIQWKDQRIEDLERRLQAEVERNNTVARRLLWVLGSEQLMVADLDLQRPNY